MRTYKYPITKLEPNQIFVFGSNTQGRHGKGAALWAKQHAGAIYGNSIGPQGQSFAIVTKNLKKQIHPSVHRDVIISQIEQLYDYAIACPDKEFLIAYRKVFNGNNKIREVINLNGYSVQEMADMFKEAANSTIPSNIIFEEEFAKLIYS